MAASSDSSLLLKTVQSNQKPDQQLGSQSRPEWIWKWRWQKGISVYQKLKNFRTAIPWPVAVMSIAQNRMACRINSSIFMVSSTLLFAVCVSAYHDSDWTKCLLVIERCVSQDIAIFSSFYLA